MSGADSVSIETVGSGDNGQQIGSLVPKLYSAKVIKRRTPAMLVMNEVQCSLLSVFSEVVALEVGTDEDAYDWCKSIQMEEISGVSVGARIFVLARLPEPQVGRDATLLATSNFFILTLKGKFITGIRRSYEFMVEGVRDSGSLGLLAPFQLHSMCRVQVNDSSFKVPCLMKESEIYDDLKCIWGEEEGSLLPSPLSMSLNGLKRGRDGGSCQDYNDHGGIDVDDRDCAERGVKKRGCDDNGYEDDDNDEDVDIEGKNGAGRGTSSRSNERVYVDLDGIKRSTGCAENLNLIHHHAHLFRLLDARRLGFFLPDLHLDVAKWKRNITIATHSGEEDQQFSSFAMTTNCQYLPVMINVGLLEAFLKMRFDMLDWKNISLVHFLPQGDANILWVNKSSPEGRGRLHTAVRNLQMVFHLNFGEPFVTCFEPLLTFLLSNREASSFHDIFIRFQIEKLLSQYAFQLGIKKMFLVQGEPQRSTPEHCALLLVSMVSALVRGFPGLEKAPHHRFYEDDGVFRQILLDEQSVAFLHRVNISKSLTQDPLPLVLAAQSPITVARGGGRVVGNERAVPTGVSTRDSSGGEICLWDLAHQCKGEIEGVRVKCEGKHGGRRSHVSVANCFEKEVQKMVQASKLSQKLKIALKNIFAANKGLFAKQSI